MSHAGGQQHAQICGSQSKARLVHSGQPDQLGCSVQHTKTQLKTKLAVGCLSPNIEELHFDFRLEEELLDILKNHNRTIFNVYVIWELIPELRHE